MLKIDLKSAPKERNHEAVDNFVQFDLRGKSSAEKVKLLILRDLHNVNWNIDVAGNKLIVSPPTEYTKDTVKSAMQMKRLELLHKNKRWIKDHMKLAQDNLAAGEDVLSSSIIPEIEVCTTQKQMDLFRMYRYYWSSPYSEYVGRRIKLIIRDAGLPSKPVIGIAALGSPIIHIPERDNWVGWDRTTRTKNLNYTMDAYVIGALPPYNHLLGGKLISYILASVEVRKIYEKKYRKKISVIDEKVSDKLVGLFTTSLYGNSSQYNRINFNKSPLYNLIGSTKGYGTLHLSQQTIEAMIVLLTENNINVTNCFGSGPIWVMRVIRAAADLLKFDADFLLKHSFKRNIYFIPYASNYREILNGITSKPIYYNYKMDELVGFWKERWFSKRKMNPAVLMNVLEFTPNKFTINFSSEA